MKSSPIILVFLLILGTGCMSTPVNNTDIGGAKEPVEFKGFMTAPDYPVYLYYLDKWNRWHSIAQFTSGNKVTKSGEDNWYLWEGEVTIPTAAWRLKNYLTGRTIYAKLAAYTFIHQVGKDPTAFPLNVMKEDFKACLEENRGATIGTIRNACKSDPPTILTLYSDCQNMGGCVELYVNTRCKSEREECYDDDGTDATDCNLSYNLCLERCSVHYAACQFEDVRGEDACESSKAACGAR